MSQISLVQVKVSIKAYGRYEDVRPNRTGRRCRTEAAVPFHLDPALAALTQHRPIIENTPVQPLREEVHAVSHACYSRSCVCAKIHWKPLAERLPQVRLVEIKVSVEASACNKDVRSDRARCEKLAWTASNPNGTARIPFPRKLQRTEPNPSYPTGDDVPRARWRVTPSVCSGAGKAVLRPVACDQVPGACGRGQRGPKVAPS
jgi:hypothetical protein